METAEATKEHVDFDAVDFSAGSRDSMAQLYEQTLKDFKEGSIVPGRILEIRNNEVLIDIGYKSEGVVPAGEFRNLDKVSVGDELNVLLAEIEDDNGMVVLSKQQADEKIQWERVLSSFGEGSVIEGEVKTRVRGGLIVDVDGIEAFLPCPRSMSSRYTTPTACSTSGSNSRFSRSVKSAGISFCRAVS